MRELWAGLQLSGNGIAVVVLDCSKEEYVVFDDTNILLQQGDRSEAYAILMQHLEDFLREKNVKTVCMKASAVPRFGFSLAHLQTAELRGIAIATVKNLGCDLFLIPKSTLSQRYGSRKADEYIKDDQFWNNKLDREIRKGSREAALLVVAAKELNQ